MDEKRTTRVSAVLMCVLVGAGLIWFAHTTQERAGRYQCDGTTEVVAERGDTLWGIAHTHCDGNQLAAVHALRELNGGESGLQVGQTVRLPVTGDTTGGE